MTQINFQSFLFEGQEKNILKKNGKTVGVGGKGNTTLKIEYIFWARTEISLAYLDCRLWVAWSARLRVQTIFLHRSGTVSLPPSDLYVETATPVSLLESRSQVR